MITRSSFRVSASTLVCTGLAITAATAQTLPFHHADPVTGRPAGMPADVGSALREIGAVIAAPQTAALYAPLHADASLEGIEVERDVRYGPAERNVLDIFTPVGDSGAGEQAASRPIVVFVHGGGFTRGDKSAEGSPFYDNVMRWAAREGLVGVNVNYRYAPEHTWPSGIDDMRAVVSWLAEHAAQYGGDPAQVFLWGHSAGAAHVGDYIADAQRRGRDPRIAGAVLTSGIYDLGDEVSVWQAYYGDDVALYDERSSLPALALSDVPLLINDAELDPESFRVDTEKLVRARTEAGKPTISLRLPNHSHLSETYAVGTSDRSLSGNVLAFIRGRR